LAGVLKHVLITPARFKEAAAFVRWLMAYGNMADVDPAFPSDRQAALVFRNSVIVLSLDGTKPVAVTWGIPGERMTDKGPEPFIRIIVHLGRPDEGDVNRDRYIDANTLAYIAEMEKRGIDTMYAEVPTEHWAHVRDYIGLNLQPSKIEGKMEAWTTFSDIKARVLARG